MFSQVKSIVAAAALCLTAGAAQATVILPGSETPLQGVINSLYQSTACPTCSPVSRAPNVMTDQYAHDQVWAIEASGTAAATFIIEIAGNRATNTFGLYDLANGNRVQLFSGAADDADRATVSLFDDGSLTVTFTPRSPNPDPGATSGFMREFGPGYFTANVFGFYLGTQNGAFYSEAGKNASGADQMVAFSGDRDLIKLPGAYASVWGPSSYILAWEDIAYVSSDKDFNDLVVYVESITGVVPEPGTLALLGLGLAGLGLARRRRG